MKKILISLVAVLLMGGKSYAQTQIATLTHGETVTYFYGDSAFVWAHDAAVHGDEVLLSSGTFVTLSITKAISVRGAGMEEDSLTAITPTILRNTCYINIPDPGEHFLQMEGICFQNDFYFGLSYTTNQPKFMNCQFRSNLYLLTEYGQTVNVNDALFIHCKIASGLRKDRDNNSYNATATATFINCVLGGITTNEAPNVFYTLRNCIINVDPRYMCNSNLSNCIINSTVTNNSFPESTYLSNCVCQSEKAFSNSMNATNKVAAMADLFEGYGGTIYTPTFNYKLKETAATTYLGTDGTQVGIWGGSLPFNAIPNGPRVKKLVVGNQQADGKLKVTVEVK
ncbi:MAG: hypothetical protein J6W75_06130 [Bacteroidaceae bacterium]|nr:hypothetical protein [Bacteroidaceae bacterium]